MTEKELLQVIREAAADGRRELNLPGRQLTALPSEIGLQGMFQVIKFTTPFLGPVIGLLDPDRYVDAVKHQLKLMGELVKKLPDVQAPKGDWRPDAEMHDELPFEGASLRALRQFLEEKDPQRQWGGLKKVLTPEGHYLWLCNRHAQEYAR